jgi:haloalkane dehalogenase
VLVPIVSSLNAPPIQTLTLPDGLTLGYRELGAGPAVLLLHGWPTSSFLWRNVMPPIAEHHRVVALDLPGFGASDKPADARYDFAYFESAIDGFLAAIGVDRVSVAGHDLGGPIAVHWVLGNADRVERLGLLNTLLYPEFSDAVVEFVRILNTPAERDKLVSAEGLAELMRFGVTDPTVISDEIAAAVAAPFADRANQLVLARAGYGLGRRGFVEIAAAIGTLRCPVAVVYGTADRVLPDVAETFARLQRDVPHATVTALPDAGHFVPEEVPQAVAGVLAPFFAGA